MLEENFKPIDDDFLTAYGRHRLKRTRKTVYDLATLANGGQFNAALLCLNENIGFSLKRFYKNFQNHYGYNEKYLMVIKAFEDKKKYRKFYEKLDKNFIDIIHKNLSLGTKVAPLVRTRSGEYVRADENLYFQNILYNERERKRADYYGKLNYLREDYELSEFVLQKFVAVDEFFKVLLEKKPLYAGILNFLDVNDEYIGFDKQTSQTLINMINHSYEFHPENPVNAYNYANMVDTIMKCKMTNRNLQKNLIEHDALTKTQDALRGLGNRKFKTLQEDSNFLGNEQTK